MKLLYVDIENFRSIKEQTIHFQPTCRILVGVNESGKSNIIKALRLLSSDFTPQKDDLRETLFDQDDDPDIEGFVRFVFNNDSTDYDKITEIICKTMHLTSDKDIIGTVDTKEYTIRDFITHFFNQSIYRVNINSREKHASYWAFEHQARTTKNLKQFKINNNWVTLSKESTPPDLEVTMKNGNSISLSPGDVINNKYFPELPETIQVPLTLKELYSSIGSQICAHVYTSLPGVVFWEYSEKYLLPSSVDVETFKNDPETCVPLKHMFQLSGYENIQEAIANAMDKSNGMDNMLNRIAVKTTAHINSIWKEHSNVSIELKDKNGSIALGVKDSSNFYSMARRSDGFKRFVTFLLMVSAKERTNQLEKTLLLFDEPDISLHPEGVRYLLAELIALSKKNIVVSSTHSIFMIDKEKSDYHIVVSKKGEITTFLTETNSRFFDEEVIYSALNYSVFENLAKKNFIFEGWKDKFLFKAALSSPKLPASIKKIMKEVGLCHSQGVERIYQIASVLETGKRECFIISDSDAAANSAKAKHTKEKNYGRWFTYKDLGEDAALTGEDFIKCKKIASAYTQLTKQYPNLPSIKAEDLPASGRLKLLETSLTKIGLTGQSLKASKLQLKDAIFDELKPSDIEEKYFEMLVKLSEELSAAS